MPTITCPMPTLLHTSPTVPPMLDIDAPIVPANGLTVAPSGDYKLTGELATVEKVIWSALLTKSGELDWDPQFGANLRHKRLRPADLSAERRRIVQLVEAVPHVTRAEVQLLFSDDEIAVAVYAETDFGTLETRR